MVNELWQLYDKQGRPIPGKGGIKDDVYGKALLHGAAHVWIWRLKNGEAEILLQKRAHIKKTFPDCLDVSAAGHIDLGEDPLNAAIRETGEELGLRLQEQDLDFTGIERQYIVAKNNQFTENEICWLYTVRLKENSQFSLAEKEVASLIWKKINEIKSEIENPNKYKLYVPHGQKYFATVFEAVKRTIDKG